MQPKVSIIIPVYNAEKYIEECIMSLLNQTLKECEFIFINDGSKDDSLKILHRYQRDDERIKIINQKNQGVSVARNNGLDIARGDYIGFVDADDYVEKDMYYTLYQTAKKEDIDVVISNWETKIDGIKTITNYDFPINIKLDKKYIEKNIFPYFIEKENLNSIWNKLYKCSIIKDNKITFQKEIVLGEDWMFNMLFFNNCNSMTYIDYLGYNYREVEGSASRNILKKDYFKNSLEVYNIELSKFLNIDIDSKEIKKMKSIKLINNVISYIYIYSTSNEISLRHKYKYIKNMITKNEVIESLKIYENNVSLGRYKKFIIKMINNKSFIGLYLASNYSKLRNH